MPAAAFACLPRAYLPVIALAKARRRLEEFVFRRILVFFVVIPALAVAGNRFDAVAAAFVP